MDGSFLLSDQHHWRSTRQSVSWELMTAPGLFRSFIKTERLGLCELGFEKYFKVNWPSIKTRNNKYCRQMGNSKGHVSNSRKEKHWLQTVIFIFSSFRGFLFLIVNMFTEIIGKICYFACPSTFSRNMVKMFKAHRNPCSVFYHGKSIFCIFMAIFVFRSNFGCEMDVQLWLSLSFFFLFSILHGLWILLSVPTFPSKPVFFFIVNSGIGNPRWNQCPQVPVLSTTLILPHPSFYDLDFTVILDSLFNFFFFLQYLLFKSPSFFLWWFMVL